MTRSPLPRPLLLPGLARLRRGPHTVQLGVDPARAVLVELPDPRVAAVLDLLDGTQSEPGVVARAAQLGASADDVHALIDTLHAAGLVVAAPTLLPPMLTDVWRQRLLGEAAALALDRTPAHHPAGGAGAERPAPTAPPIRPAERPDDSDAHPADLLQRRFAARVVVTGPGRLASAVAVALAQSGVGHIHADLPGIVTQAELAGSPLGNEDVGLPRHRAVAAAIVRAAPGTQNRPIRRRATLILHFGQDAPAALLAARHARRGEAHLAVTIRDGTAVVGPLVPPHGGPCLHCLDLHRRDRDPYWPVIAAQLATAAPEPCTVATLLAATACTTAEALRFLDGGAPGTIGGAVEISGPARFRRRGWAPHPACGCTRPGRGTTVRRTGRPTAGTLSNAIGHVGGG